MPRDADACAADAPTPAAARCSRRRALRVIGGAAALAALRGDVVDPAAPMARWRGTAMGARASILLAHPDAARLTALAAAEIARLERVFSLRRADSALVRLNRQGALTDPPPDLVAALRLAQALHDASDGAFDPGVQPLWRAHADAWAAGAPPTAAAVDAARRRLGVDAALVEDDCIALGRAGAALTLNGMAQGWIADAVAALLRAEGVADALVDAGELAALGRRPGGAPWRVGLPNGRALGLRGAVATSAVLGDVFDPDGRAGHILDPRTGRPARPAVVTVAAPSAALADALSTAAALLDAQRAAALAAGHDARVVHHAV